MCLRHWTQAGYPLLSDKTTTSAGEITFPFAPPVSEGKRAIIRASKGGPIIQCTVKVVERADGIVSVHPDDFRRLRSEELQSFEIRAQRLLDRIRNVFSIKGVVIVAAVVLIIGPVVTTVFWSAPEPVSVPPGLVGALQQAPTLAPAARAKIVSELQQLSTAESHRQTQLRDHNEANWIVFIIMVALAVVVVIAGVIPLSRYGV